VGQIDNRGSHFYLALYWAQELAKQDKDPELKVAFKTFAKTLTVNADEISNELIKAQGKPQDIGGYYHPDAVKTDVAMRPSETLNAILDDFMG
jgi:isocitrate dehydrogenase